MSACSRPLLLRRDNRIPRLRHAQGVRRSATDLTAAGPGPSCAREYGKDHARHRGGFARPSTEQVNYSKMPLQIARAGFGISGAPGMILTRAPSRAPFALGVKITPGPQTCSRATIGLRPRRSWRTRRVDGARDVSKVLRPLHAVFVVGLRLVAAVVPPLGVNLAADNRNALVSALCGGYPAAQ